jgi:hypothetical protein
MLILSFVPGIEPKVTAVAGISVVTIMKVYFILITRITEQVFGSVVFAVSYV